MQEDPDAHKVERRTGRIVVALERHEVLVPRVAHVDLLGVMGRDEVVGLARAALSQDTD